MAAQSCNTNITSLPSTATQTSTPYSHATPAEDSLTLTGLAPPISCYQLTSEEDHILQQIEDPRSKQPLTPGQSSLRSTHALSTPRKPVPGFLGRHTDIQRIQLHISYSFSATLPPSSSFSRQSVLSAKTCLTAPIRTSRKVYVPQSNGIPS